MIITAVIVSVIISWISWNYIHELSHILAAKILGVAGEDWWIKPYPHFYKGHLRFAAANIDQIRKTNDYEKAIISLAPKIPNIVTAICFSLSGLVFPTVFPLSIFFGAGLIDTIYNSAGLNEYTDIRRAAKALDVSVWRFRIAGYLISIISIWTFIAFWL